MALPTLHPLVKTSIELRRSLFRLETFLMKNPNDAYSIKVQELIEHIKDARNAIPKEMQDVDLGGW